MEDVVRAIGITPPAAATIASAPETAVSPVSEDGTPASAGETILSRPEETEGTKERAAPTTATPVPEPLAPAADATALASAAEPSVPVTEEHKPATQVTPAPTVQATAPPAPPLEAPPAPVDQPSGPVTVVPPARTATREAVIDRAPPPARGRSLRGATIGIAAVIVALAAAGFFAGRGNAPSHVKKITAATQRSVKRGDVSLSAPVTWRRLTSAPSIPGLKLTNTIALAPMATGDSAGSLVGNVAAAWPTFLPASFRSAVGERAVRRHEIVRLGDLSAFRYSRLSPRGFHGVVTVYAVPQPKRATIVACYGSASASALAKCDSIAASLKLANAKPYPLDPSPHYAAVLNGALTTLKAARRKGLVALAAAKTQAAQATAAGTIAAAYGRAARTLRGAKPTAYIRPANLRILAALTRTQTSYTRLQSAARTGDSGRYESARRLIRANEAAVRSEVNGLTRLGFKL